jgi:hypothetical protein
LIDYFANSNVNGRKVNVRMLTFLSSLPNFGVGSLVERFIHPLSSSIKKSPSAPTIPVVNALLATQSSFYRILGERAASCGICIDLYALPTPTLIQRPNHIPTSSPASVSSDGSDGTLPSYIDFPTLKYLTFLTGGNLLFFETTIDCSLPQDVFRQLSKPQVLRRVSHFQRH